jgi:hypothetical protein
MADKDKPEEVTQKKKGLLAGSKIPLDGVLLVVVPFVTFVMLFMYVMGLLPPRPMTVRVVGAAPMEEAQPVETGASGGSVPGDYMDMDEDAVPAQEAGEPPADMTPVAPEPGDSISIDAAGPALADEETEQSQPEAAVTDEAAESEASGNAPEVDGERMERIKQLAKVYEQMNASSVAAIVTSMSEDEAVGILSNMKPRNAAKVLASLEPEKAAKLSLRLTE